MSDWTEDAVAAAVARLEGQGVRQDAAAPRPAPRKGSAPRAPQKPAQPAAAPALGTEAGMVALWDQALAAHGADLPPACEQYLFAAPWRKWAADYAWPAARLLVELDGMAWQAGGGHHNTDEDRFRNNSAVALGWRMLHFTSKALRTEPATCIALVRRALEVSHA